MTSSPPHDRVPASDGQGALLQRDYWAVVKDARLDACAVGRLLAERFCDLSPPELVRFSRRADRTGPLEPGDELDVRIRAAGSFGVRVLHRDERSLTVGTLAGHPEAGRITFGAYANRRGDLVIHIRSRARSSSRGRLLGFLFAGEPMQTSTWAEFLDRLAALAGDGVLGAVHAETREVEEVAGDGPDGAAAPTFRAVGG